jgi:hypothetical protein
VSCLTDDLLAELEAGTLDDTSATEAKAHLAQCEACRGFQARLLAAAASLATIDAELVDARPSAASWERIAARIGSAPAVVAPEVAIGCAYCKGKLARPEAVYCAGCLAPHHADCWREHGRCAACAVTMLVRAEAAPVKPRKAPTAIAFVFALAFGAGAAALVGRGRDATHVVVAPPAPVTAPPAAATIAPVETHAPPEEPEAPAEAPLSETARAIRAQIQALVREGKTELTIALAGERRISGHYVTRDKRTVTIAEGRGQTTVRFEQIVKVGGTAEEEATQWAIGDTVRVGFTSGRIVELTPGGVLLREWSGNGWGSVREFDRNRNGGISHATLKRSFDLGAVHFTEERQRANGRLRLRGSLRLETETVLGGAQLVFSAGPIDSDLDRAPAFTRSVAVEPLFMGESVTHEQVFAQEDGQVTLQGEPLASLRSKAAKPIILKALATRRAEAPKAPVYRAGILNGDDEILEVLVHRACRSSQDLPLELALRPAGDAVARILLDGIAAPETASLVARATREGTVERTEPESVLDWKADQLDYLRTVRCSSDPARARRLLDILLGAGAPRGASWKRFRAAVDGVFGARADETVDGLLPLASAKPRDVDARLIQMARGILETCPGEAVLDELLKRLDRGSAEGGEFALQLEASRHATPPVSTERLKGLALDKLRDLASGRGPAPAPGEDTCTGVLVDFVDFSVPPQKVEGQNKVRIAVSPTVDPATHAVSIEVMGTAYYPDGTVILVGVRHGKRDDFFAKARVEVKDHTFHHSFGPFTKTIPGGGLVVEARFYLSDQKPAIGATLVRDQYFHCAPPCPRDQRNKTEVAWSHGGPEAEAVSVAEEKEAIETARTALSVAHVAASARLAPGAEAIPVAEARAALDRLEADATAAVETHSRWAKTREFLLFPERRTQLVALKAKVVSAARAGAVLRGVPVAGLDEETARTLAATASQDTKSLLEDLETFHAETDSTDKTHDGSPH